MNNLARTAASLASSSFRSATVRSGLPWQRGHDLLGKFSEWFACFLKVLRKMRIGKELHDWFHSYHLPVFDINVSIRSMFGV